MWKKTLQQNLSVLVLVLQYLQWSDKYLFDSLPLIEFAPHFLFSSQLYFED